ncbi:MAG: alpha/beta hydrolase, partial [Phaeodactylibacter sp.]|nr:alpha/beta hydrolase [Phaeodactylibacter sp.]
IKFNSKMKQLIVVAFLILGVELSNAQNLQKVSAGKVDRIENFASRFVEPRHIDIWLPENYDGKKKFSVLYMHDGQMLFDSTTTWNHQSWNVDDVATRLMEGGKIRDVIVVGVWNPGQQRHADYFPQKPFEGLSLVEKDTVIRQLQQAGRTTEVFQPNSDNYLKFLVSELKPVIDKKYRVHTGRKHTFIAGSSMGGLISMYAICEYPSVFGGAACLSTHWPGTFTLDNNPAPDAFIRYLKNNLPNPGKHKIYFDCGDQTLDALYPAIQQQVDEVMKTKGFSEKNWKTAYFRGKGHSESAWSERLDIPLVFLLKR